MHTSLPGTGMSVSKHVAQKTHTHTVHHSQPVVSYYSEAAISYIQRVA